MYKAEIISISNVDASGNMEVVYKIWIDKEVKYDNMQVNGRPDSIVGTIKQQMAELKRQIDEVGKIKVGDEIIL